MNQSDVFRIVANPDRRRIVQFLLENGGQATIEDLSTQLATHRQEASTGSVGALKQTKIDLVHNHLPRLQDHGVIKYDQQTGDVLLDAGEELKPYLMAAPAQTRSMSPEW